jgi:hypothetical protein
MRRRVKEEKRGKKEEPRGKRILGFFKVTGNQ